MTLDCEAMAYNTCFFVECCRFCRVNFILALRLELLKEVERLQV